MPNLKENPKMNISSKRVREMTKDSLFKLIDIDRTLKEPLVVKAIERTYRFHPDRVASHELEVSSMLHELPEIFKNGYSFDDMAYDKLGRRWTNYQSTMEDLMSLGIATGQVSYVMPRDFWSAFPGGVPFIQIHPKKLN